MFVSDPINTLSQKLFSKLQSAFLLSDSEFYFSQTGKDERFGKLVSDSSIALCRKSTANSEEAESGDNRIQAVSLQISGLVLFYIILSFFPTVTLASTLTQVLGFRIFLTQPGRSLNAGYSWPGVFLLGASGRTGRFFTQLLFHNPHSTTIIRQIHLVWQ